MGSIQNSGRLVISLTSFNIVTGTKFDMALSVSDVNSVLQADTVHNCVRQPLQRRAKGKAVAARSTLADVKNRTASRSLRFNKTGKLPVKGKPGPEETLPEAKPETVVPAVQDIPLPPPGVTNIDEEEENPQLCHEYAPLLYHYLREIEASQPIRKDFLKNCHVNGKMRAVLIDWLVEVHAQFKLLPETLYLTVAILDRYLAVRCADIKRKKLQLVGVSCMWIASKYEEMYAPEINDFVYITDNAYSTLEIRSMELDILRVLDFNLGKPLPLHFLRRNSKAAGVDAKQHNFAKFFMEMTLQEYSFVHVSPSELAAAALCLSCRVINQDTEEGVEKLQWEEKMVHYSGYEESALEPLMASIASFVVKSETSKLNFVKQKYQSSKFMRISASPLLKAEHFTTIAKSADGPATK